MIFMICVTLYPMLHVLFSSLSKPELLMAYSGPLIKPLGFSIKAYEAVFNNKYILNGFINTSIIVVSGVTLNVFMTSLGAYFLSRKDVLFQRPITLFIIFTMYFQGGLIPFYFTVKGLGIDNTFLAIILPTAINTFNLIILRTGFASIPASLEEAARIDGASDYTVLCRVVLPLAKPMVAVVTLYYLVSHWNSWFNAMIFLTDKKMYPLQLILREILVQNDTSSMSTYSEVGQQESIGETIKYATIMIVTLPILFVYPFVQKYFEKGVMIGAVKQ
ncbi:ABC transporter permease subunit [Paenibacillus sp. LMG 31461]|uniref:ABC transporter permease subunit n=1 Tax=Paenibacillus plantarum TaxID=2654975 RepID=A0ABX1X313_9BACL|nr:carbohydrate ABC transporter permease [Paenibacillus plantarum]NOU62465.1 ABC transporter permease subunit [Paenibacillus plantarum]